MDAELKEVFREHGRHLAVEHKANLPFYIGLILVIAIVEGFRYFIN